MDRGAWQATVRGVAKESTYNLVTKTTKILSSALEHSLTFISRGESSLEFYNCPLLSSPGFSLLLSLSQRTTDLKQHKFMLLQL